MPDNYRGQRGTYDGPDVASDNIDGVIYPRVKMMWGADGTAEDVSATHPLPLGIADGGNVVEGATTDAAVVTDTTGTISGKLRGLVKWAYERMPASLGQKAKTASLPVVLASDQDALVLAAGEAHIGAMGGTTPYITPTITVDTAVYASGDCLGGKITLANAVRVSGGTGVWQSLMLLDRSGQKPTGELFIFESDPSAATLNDNAAIVFSTDDLKVCAKLTISASDWVTVSSEAFANIRGIGAVVKAVGSTTLYAAWALTSAPDFVAGTDFQMRLGILAD